MFQVHFLKNAGMKKYECISRFVFNPGCAIYAALDTTTAHNLKNKISHQAGRGQWVLNEEHQQQFTVQ